jgi:hypothetical protein
MTKNEARQFIYAKHACAKKFLNKGMSPLHACCLFLLDQLKEKYHVCGVVNLYISSEKFFHEANVSKNQVLCHGAVRKSGRGLPKMCKSKRAKNHVNAR